MKFVHRSARSHSSRRLERLCAGLLLLVCLAAFSPIPARPPAVIAPTNTAPTSPGRLPLAFFPLDPSSHHPAAIAARTPAGDLVFQPGGVTFRLPDAGREVRLQFIGSNPGAAPIATGRLPGVVNLFHGRDPRQWRNGLPTYAGLVYRNLYPGIDLHYSGQSDGLKATYVVAPGATVQAIRFQYTPADSIKIDPGGDLHITLSGRLTLRETAPVAWQVIDGRKRPVKASFTLSGGTVRFTLDAFDPSFPLVIDPTLLFSGFIGGNGNDEATDIALDHEGNILIIGSTKSTNFSTVDPIQFSLSGGQDAFVIKLNPDATLVLFATYLGGSAMDEGAAIATDINADGVNEIQDGSVWIAGRAPSNDFPTTPGTYEPDKVQSNGFLAKISASGGLVYSTYVGGDGAVVTDLAVDPAGNAYVAGTVMAGYPIVNGFDTTLAGMNEGFIARFNATGTAIDYASYLGGDSTETPNGLTISGDRVVVAGLTNSTANFPVTAGALQALYGGGPQDAFITVIQPSLSGAASLLHSTLLGGNNYDQADAAGIDAAGNVCVAGRTGSSNFPLANAYQDDRLGAADAFLTCMASNLGSLVFSTLLGGSAFDAALDLYIHPSGEIYLTGYTLSNNFPLMFPNDGYNAAKEAFIVMFPPGASALLYSSYLSGSGDDTGLAVLGGLEGGILVAGSTDSVDFPLAGPTSNPSGGLDAFLTILAYTEPIKNYLPLITR